MEDSKAQFTFCKLKYLKRVKWNKFWIHEKKKKVEDKCLKRSHIFGILHIIRRVGFSMLLTSFQKVFWSLNFLIKRKIHKICMIERQSVWKKNEFAVAVIVYFSSHLNYIFTSYRSRDFLYSMNLEYSECFCFKVLDYGRSVILIHLFIALLLFSFEASYFSRFCWKTTLLHHCYMEQ